MRALLFLLTVALGCGGSVVVDPGAGGGTTTDTTTSVAPTCGQSTCGQTGASCSCEAVCGSTHYRVECGPNAKDGSYGCTCYADDLLVAPCQDSPTSACDVQGGCCATFFFD